MEHIDDEIVAGTRLRGLFTDGGGRLGAGKNAEGRAAVVRPWIDGGLAAVIRRKVDGGREGVEQDLLPVETKAAGVIVTAFDAPGVVSGPRRGGERNPAMPDAAGFIGADVETVFEEGLYGIGGAVEQQRHAGGPAGVKDEIPGFERRNPGNAHGAGRALFSVPFVETCAGAR